jgi:hypothetical protein
MTVNTMAGASGIFLCCALLFPQPSTSQSPAPLGKLHITSKPPDSHASITINGATRQEQTPVTLAVVPNTYTVVIGNCTVQPLPVTVASGETKEVTCGK